MSITTAAALKEYALRKLGSPVIQIEISDDQVSDRLDDTLQQYGKYHDDGFSDDYFLINTVAGEDTYTMDSDIIAVTEVLRNVESAGTTDPSFDAQWDFYQTRLSFSVNSLTNYATWQQSIQTLRHFQSFYSNHFTFNRITHQIKIYPTPQSAEIIAFRAYKTNDPETFGDIYNDDWVKEYFTALVGFQWGSNISKYKDVVLPSGMVLDGQRILEDYKEEKNRLEEKLRKEHHGFPMFFTG